MRLLEMMRTGMANLTRHVPEFRGLGRMILAADGCLTSPRDPLSFLVTADINHGCRLRLDLRGREQKFAYYYGRWENSEISAVRRHFQTGVFYDVGASIGLYAMTFGRLCQVRGSYLRAFEPIPDNLQRLREQLVLNGLNEHTVRIEPVAVGDTSGIVSLTLMDSGRPGNAKIVASGEYSATITTLDDVWRQDDREQVGFLKIDTEGWDAKILMGARELIRTCRPNLLVEFNRERMRNLDISLDDVWRFLVDELQYACYRIDGSGREIALTAPEAWENLLFVAAAR